jgi:hypothetical protein
MGKDEQILKKFVSVYCNKKHGSQQNRLCDCCNDLLSYALDRLSKCPFDPKPKCKDCKVHCYSEKYRTQIREVMKFSGMHFVKHGRLDRLFKYLLK